MRDIDHIIIHCSATREGQDFDISDIREWHKAKGWSDVGYHYVIKLDGTVQPGRKHKTPGAHVRGYNKNSLGVCYIGGVGDDGKGKDTRTAGQKLALTGLIKYLTQQYPNASVKGHRDFSVDLDADGIIEEHEWMKECPSFNVKNWMIEISNL